MTERGPRPYLIDRMRARAEADQLEGDHPVRTTAERAERLAVAYGTSPLAVRRAMLIARSVWRAYSGESTYEGGR